VVLREGAMIGMCTRQQERNVAGAGGSFSEEAETGRTQRVLFLPVYGQVAGSEQVEGSSGVRELNAKRVTQLG